MRLDEIERRTAEVQRVERLKDTAKAAKDKAKQLTTRANLSADQLKMQKSRDQLTKARTPSSTTMIKPHA
jgi:hypothetical protein